MFYCYQYVWIGSTSQSLKSRLCALQSVTQNTAFTHVNLNLQINTVGLPGPHPANQRRRGLPGGNLLFFGRPKKSRQKKTAPGRLPRAVLAGGPHVGHTPAPAPCRLPPPNRDRHASNAYRRHNGPRRCGQNVVLMTPQGGF